ncbi:beta-amyrin 6-beta-monooxygenase-like [Amaranthus tricolor]|uniref:beta-amyrin 6-beta-monooxygenase-like n=1 Tax=Amaranthus tricolor TaxID=29722 RepID=UPI00258766CC|nr:beta-amyrin 6-beta-monooxygenase-like [Amaranthus tricolor]
MSLTSILLLGIISLIILFLIRLIFSHKSENPTRNESKLPPGRTGWPIIGETLTFITNPEKFVQERMKKYSPEIFKTSVAGGKMAVLCGPAGNKFLFSNETNKSVTPWWPKSISQHLMFPNTDLWKSSTPDDNSFLKVESMQKYVSFMDSMAKDHVQTRWAPHKEVEVHPLSKEFTFALACRIFINYENPEQVKELAQPFFDVAKGIMSAPLNIPGTSFNGAVKGGALIKEKLLQIIKQRKEELHTKKEDDDHKQITDLLSRLLVCCDDNGMFLTEERIANKIIGYLLASFFTTSITITFVLSHLSKHPHVYDKVLEEQLEIKKSKGVRELLSWADIQKMKYTWNVVCESMRLAPPSFGAFKETRTDLTYAGFTIPKGWKVSWSVHSTYKDPKYFKNPEKFDPSRFEGNGAAPFTFVPFGGGPRMCAGKEYARIQILAFVHNVVTNFRLKMANLNEKIYYNPEPIPANGMRICLQPHHS